MQADQHHRPPLSPQEGWLRGGRQVLHFRTVRYSRYSQALELKTGELTPSPSVSDGHISCDSYSDTPQELHQLSQAPKDVLGFIARTSS